MRRFFNRPPGDEKSTKIRKKKSKEKKRTQHTASQPQAANKPITSGNQKPKTEITKKNVNKTKKYVDVVRVMCCLHQKPFPFCEYLTTTSQKAIVTETPFTTEIPLWGLNIWN